MADILAFEDVCVTHQGRAGALPILDHVSLRLEAGAAFGLVGESGCGKSTVALATMRFLPRGMSLTSGRILFEGRDLAALDTASLRRLRGRRVAMVYQDPMAALNPVMTIGRQLMEVPLLHGERDARKAKELRRLGFRVLTLWECDVRDAARLGRKLEGFLGLPG